MAPVATFIASERLFAPQQNQSPRELDQAVAPYLSGTIVRMARNEDFRSLLQLAQTLIGGEHATENTVRRVALHRPDSIWSFMQGSRIVGVFAMLLLNRVGVRALLAKEMNTRDPSLEFLAVAGETPVGIYFWAVAHSSASDGILQMFGRLQSPPYDSANIYAFPVTASGLRFLRGWGFKPVTGHSCDLYRYVRLAKRRELGGLHAHELA